MLETDNYEKFKKDILQLAGIDLNSYKEKQMRRRINTLITKNNVKTYNDYVALIKKDKEKFDQFINFLTINVSEFYRNPDQWKILEGRGGSSCFPQPPAPAQPAHPAEQWR